MDLEDWSAHKAVTAVTLEPGQTLNAIWPMRLIASGHYRLVVCLVGRETGELITSPVAAFAVRSKPVVASARVLPVTPGMPLLLGGLLVWRWRRSRKEAALRCQAMYLRGTLHFPFTGSEDTP